MKRAPDSTLQAITYEKNEIESGLLIMMYAKRILEGESLVFEQVRTTVFFMPPTSKKSRGHIGLGRTVRLSVCLSVRPSVTLYGSCKTQEPLMLEPCKFICGMYMKNKRTPIFFSPPVLSFWSYAPFWTIYEHPCEQNICRTISGRMPIFGI